MTELGPRLIENGRLESRAYFTQRGLAEEWFNRICKLLPGPYAHIICTPTTGGWAARWWA